MQLNDYIKVKRRYSRSVNLERDLQIPDSVKGYILTPKTASLIKRFTQALSTDDSVRAWTVTGVYGTGKSAFAHFLTSLCSDEKDRIRVNALEVVQNSGLEITDSSFDLPEKGLIKAVATAQGEPVSKTILRGLYKGVNDEWTGKRGKKPLVHATINDLYSKIDSTESIDNKKVLDLIKETAKVSKRGLLILVDELGKNLEYASRHQAGGDLYLLQQIAELPSGKQNPKVFFIGLLHQSFADYSHSLTSAQRNEWGKIQGRFEDIPLSESSDRLLYVIGNAIDHDDSSDIAPIIISWAKKWRKTLAQLQFSNSFADKELSSIYPMHPVAAMTLPVLCNKFSQNDRTLFTFLASEEPHSFTSFLKANKVVNKQLPTLQIHQLYDYFIEYAGVTMSLRPQYQRWVEIQSRISDAHDLDADSLNLLKTIGILNLIANTGSLRATRNLVIMAMNDEASNKDNQKKWSTVIDSLITKGFITWRKQLDELRIWEGSDFNIDKEVAEQLELIRTPLADMLNEFYPQRPMVARRHSYQTGTLRYFEKTYIDKLPEQAVITSSDCDGLIYYLLDSKATSSSIPKKTATGKPVIVVQGQDIDALRLACNEYVALRNIETHAKQLQTDGVARKELKQRLFLAKGVLDDVVASSFNFTINNVNCWMTGDKLKVKSDKALNNLLSVACDDSYRNGLKVWNELINRNQLSGQGSRARRQLFEAMINNQGQEHLGITGHGPDFAMFESLLISTGLYKKDNDNWIFESPDKTSGIYDVWKAVEEFCKSASDNARSVDELYTILEQPPYGMKHGAIPIVLLSVLLYHSDYLSVYFEGTYLPILTAPRFELLIKRPDKFAIKYFEISGLREQLFKELGEVISHASPVATQNVRNQTLLGVVNPLVKFIKKLPSYALKTDHISDEAKAVRKAIMEAREPDQLLFIALPNALRMKSMDNHISLDSDEIQGFRKKLISSLKELESAYKDILTSSENLLFKAFAVRSARVQLRDDLAVRAGHLNGRVVEPLLKRFITTSINSVYDDKQWLESVLMVIADKPVRSWTDQDVILFETKLSDLARRFMNLESIQSEMTNDFDGSFDARKLTVTYPEGNDLNTVVWIDHKQKAAIEKIAEKLIAEVSQHDESTKKAIILSLIEGVFSEKKDLIIEDENELKKHG